MNKATIFLILGAVLVIGIVAYFMFKDTATPSVVGDPGSGGSSGGSSNSSASGNVPTSPGINIGGMGATPPGYTPPVPQSPIVGSRLVASADYVTAYSEPDATKAITYYMSDVKFGKGAYIGIVEQFIGSSWIKMRNYSQPRLGSNTAFYILRNSGKFKVQ